MPRQKKRLNKSLRAVSRLDRGNHEKTWILLMQRTQAKLMEYRASTRVLEFVEGFVNPSGDKKTGQLVSDRPGRLYRQAVGTGRSPATSSEDAHEHSLSLFAKELAATVQKGLAVGRCNRLILAAEPHCLGKIKKSLNAKTQKRVAGTVSQDLFRLDSTKLFEKLKPMLR